MKRISYFAAIVFTAILAVCCSKNNSQKDVPTEGEGGMTITLNVEQATTKANATDSSLTDVQVFIFTSNDPTASKLYRYHKFSDKGISEKKDTLKSINAGSGYVVYVVANGPDLSKEVKTINLKSFKEDIYFRLERDNNFTKGFVMSGYQEGVEVTSGGTKTVTINLERYASRVNLVSIKNSVAPQYGDIILGNVYLTNVVSIARLDKSDISTVLTGLLDTLWLNKEGRYTYTSPIKTNDKIDGDTGHCQAKELTFYPINSPVQNGVVVDVNRSFYGLSNSSGNTPDGFVQSFPSHQQSCLVVEATIGGVKYYYPVVLTNGLYANKQYNVELTILGFGSNDPNQPVKKGAIEASVSVAPWTVATSYVEEI